MPKPIILSAHAERVMIEREVERVWVDAAVRQPDWTEEDPLDAVVKRHFLAVPERDGRILRVACIEKDDIILVVTAFLDRDARRPA